MKKNISIKHYFAMSVFPLLSFFAKHPKVAGLDETMDKILDGKSIARFGDGELQAITNNIDNSFQTSNQELSDAIKVVLNSKNKDLLIAIAPPFSWTLVNLNNESRNYWEPILIKNWAIWEKYLGQKYYYNAFITRPYFDYTTKFRKTESKKIFKKFKQLWNNKNILIIEGEYSRFGVNDDLLNSSKSVKRIIGPSKNAFEKIDEIEKQTRQYVNQHSVDLILLSLGQTATILTYRLLDLNIQLIDIGHLDIEYNWFLEKATTKHDIVGKWTNESKIKFKEFSNPTILRQYYSEIITKI